MKQFNFPEKRNYANLPTPVQKLEWASKELGVNFYLKRDDFTGLEYSGNKIRKLEYSFAELYKKGCDAVITCGGIQSNHCRATAALAAREHIKCVLVLRKKAEEPVDSNHFLDKLLGAEIKYITGEEYANSRMLIMEQVKAELAKEGYTAYIIPEGASNGIGNFGYAGAMNEIAEYEEASGIHFDMICSATGSGGTTAGLILGNKLLGRSSRIVGVNVCDDAGFFKNKIYSIILDSLSCIDAKIEITKEEIEIMDGYVGEGYAVPSEADIEIIKQYGKNEGIIFDQVYTSKALRGITENIKKGLFKECKNILFIHTGGIYGLFAAKSIFGY